MIGPLPTCRAATWAMSSLNPCISRILPAGDELGYRRIERLTAERRDQFGAEMCGERQDVVTALPKRGKLIAPCGDPAGQVRPELATLHRIPERSIGRAD